MDEKVFRFVAHTGFAHFEKGVLWHERMYVLISFPPPISFTSSARPPFDSDKLLGTGLFNACVYELASFDCLYAHRSPAKEISGESCVHSFLPLSARIHLHLHSGPSNCSPLLHKGTYLRLSHL